MKNLEIRNMVTDNGLRFVEVADEMNISKYWLSTLLSKELSVANRLRIMSAITRLLQERQKENE